MLSIESVLNFLLILLKIKNSSKRGNTELLQIIKNKKKKKNLTAILKCVGIRLKVGSYF